MEMIGIGNLLNPTDLNATRLMNSQLGNLRNLADATLPAGETRPLEKARKLYESASTPEEMKMKNTANEFVSILYGMLFKEMDKTVDKTGFLDGGKGEEMFHSMVFDDYAKSASSHGSNAMAQRIYETLYDANSRKAAPQPTL